MSESEFAIELRQLLNRHCKEDGSNTPDYLLAGYLIDSLAAYDKTLSARDKWFGFNPWDRKPPEPVSVASPTLEIPSFLRTHND